MRIGTNGKLTGFAHGLAMKKKLINLERQSSEININSAIEPYNKSWDIGIPTTTAEQGYGFRHFAAIP